MSTGFDNLMKADAAGIISAAGEFADPVTLILPNGDERDVYAIIERDPPEQVGSDGMVRKPKLVLDLNNDSVTGVASDEIATGWKLRVAKRIGGTAEDFPISPANIKGNQDAAVLRLEV